MDVVFIECSSEPVISRVAPELAAWRAEAQHRPDLAAQLRTWDSRRLGVFICDQQSCALHPALAFCRGGQC